MRKPLIAANWKMNKNINETKDFLSEFVLKVKDIKDRDIVVCPPFTSLFEAYKIIKSSNVKLGAQNMYFELKGAFTGEISPVMLKDVGCEYVILGHSERRQYFNETDEIVNKKLLSALNNGFIAIVCIGETLQERENNKTFEVLKYQINNSLKRIPSEYVKKVVIAYEPIWAIGTGRNATASQAQEAHKFIRDEFANVYSAEIAKEVRILYGGSIKPENFQEIINMSDVDGGLVGGASLDVESFYKIVNFKM